LLKHKLKTGLRELYARLLFHSGLHVLVDRLMPRRLTILFGHCVDAPEHNGFLPPDMKIRREKLAAILGWLGRRYELCTVGGGFESLRAGANGGRSLVALSMDDGYRDNRTELVPLLAELGAPATVFLESRPLDERRVNWSHKLFWAVGRTDVESWTRGYLKQCRDAATRAALEQHLASGAKLLYHVKRVLKYDAPVAERDAIVDRLFVAAGGDERALCDELYLDWQDARELDQAGLELGGHTISHAILSRLDAEGAAAETGGCAASMARELPGWEPRTFAYPFGRRWDYDATSVEAARSSGWTVAVNTHAGTNEAGADPMQLARLPIDDGTPLHLIAAEACGGFQFLRRLGLDLSE